MKLTAALVQRMMTSFPNFEKAHPAYLATITELIASYSEKIQKAICDVKFGVPSKTEFLPAAKVIIDFASPLVADEAISQQSPATVNWDLVETERQEMLNKLNGQHDKKMLQENLVKEQKSIWRKQRNLN